MNDMESRFLEEIRSVAKGMKRVRFPELCLAFGKVFPALTGLDQRRRMHELLHSLRTLGEVTLPTGRVHYDRMAEPHLPHWLHLVSIETRDIRPAFDPAVFPWAPELHFAATLRNPQQLEVAQRAGARHVSRNEPWRLGEKLLPGERRRKPREAFQRGA